MAKKILMYSMKGGIGKTTIQSMNAWNLAKDGHKVLAVDLDPQANLTNILFNTFGHKEPQRGLFDSFVSGDLTTARVHLSENLDLLVSDWSMSLFVSKFESIDTKTRNLILRELLKPFENQYEYILLDVPPTISTLTNNAVLASDFVAIVLQTQQASFDGALKTVTYLNQLRNDYSADFSMIGVVVYLLKRSSVTENDIVKTAKETFGDLLFTNQVLNRERVKRWAMNGITDNVKDVNDRNVHSMFNFVTAETLRRISEMEKE